MAEPTILAPQSDTPADPKVTKPPADKPITTALGVFEALFAVPLRRMRGVPSADVERYLRHAFYAGARAAFNGVLDAMREQDEGHGDGEKRFAAIEEEIEAYFRDAIGRQAVSRGDRAS